MPGAAPPRLTGDPRGVGRVGLWRWGRREASPVDRSREPRRVSPLAVARCAYLRFAWTGHAPGPSSLWALLVVAGDAFRVFHLCAKRPRATRTGVEHACSGRACTMATRLPGRITRNIRRGGTPGTTPQLQYPLHASTARGVHTRCAGHAHGPPGGWRGRVGLRAASTGRGSALGSLARRNWAFWTELRDGIGATEPVCMQTSVCAGCAMQTTAGVSH